MYDGDRNAAIERALTRIFKRGEPAPSADVVFDAYPFSKRKSDPYQRWCSRLTAYRDAHAAGLPYPADVSHRADPTEPAIDRETLDLFGQEG